MSRPLRRIFLAAIFIAGAQFSGTSARAAADLVVAVAENLNGLDPHDLNDNISQAASRLTGNLLPG